jgi:hypothetical protein
MTTFVNRIGTGLLATASVIFVLVSLPAVGGSGVLSHVAPQQAEAFEGGWDRDHWWIKVTNGEVASGIVTVACIRTVSPMLKGRVCTPLSQAAKASVGGAAGFWAEIYPPRWVWLSNGLGWWTQPYYRHGTW